MLRFEVKKCSAIGRRLSTGFTNEFFAVGKFEGKARYKLSFWIKNTNSRFTISAGSVTSKTGEIKTLMEKNQDIEDWKFYEYEIDVPDERWLKMELNILQPGTFWIDDIKIEKI